MFTCFAYHTNTVIIPGTIAVYSLSRLTRSQKAQYVQTTHPAAYLFRDSQIHTVINAFVQQFD